MAVERLGADDAGHKIITEVGLVFYLYRLVDPLSALASHRWVVEAAAATAAQIRQTGGAMIVAKRFSLDAGIFTAIPAGQSHNAHLSSCPMIHRDRRPVK